MDLLTYAGDGSTRLGMRTDEGIVDLTDALGVTDVGSLLARPEWWSA